MAALYKYASRLVSGRPERSHAAFKMLVIGETGSGKTSFLNLLCNCNVIEAMGFDEGLTSFRRFNDIKLENAKASQMESKTSDAKLYNVKLTDLEVGFIDTPGFGDSRGIEEDEQHSRKIVRLLESETYYVNCICLVINGRTPRMSATLQYVLTEVTAILPKVVLNNVIVVFTNSADPLDCTFDPTELKRFFGKEIEEKRIFYIENPYCRLEKAKEKKDILPHDRIAQSLKKAFDETREVLKEMHGVIKDFKSVYTHHFATLYKTKQEIERKVMKLLTAYDNQTELESKIARAQEEADAALASKNLHANFRSTQVIRRWKQVSTDRHNTLCGATGCYSNCHIPCYLDKSFDKAMFKHCASMRGGDYCVECGHHYNVHYHNEVEHVEEEYVKEFIDEDMRRQFQSAQSMEELAHILKQKLNSEREVSEQKRKEFSDQLLLTIEDFQKLGVTRNYAKVLENQLAVVEHRLKGDTGKKTKHLRQTKEKIEKKLKVVEDTLREPWSDCADPQVQKEWAWKVLGVDHSAGKSRIERAFRELARSSHPDKGGVDDKEFKRLQRAREILLA